MRQLWHTFLLNLLQSIRDFCAIVSLWLVVFWLLFTVNAATNDADLKGPVFLKEPTNRVDFSNSTGAVVECKASGNPPPEIIWVRSDGTAVGDVPGLRQVKFYFHYWHLLMVYGRTLYTTIFLQVSSGFIYLVNGFW